MNKMETSSGEIIEVLPVGTTVRHKKYPELVGKIVRYEYHESGKLSPLPYCVHWEEGLKAGTLLGWFSIYPNHNEIEEEPNAKVSS